MSHQNPSTFKSTSWRLFLKTRDGLYGDKKNSIYQIWVTDWFRNLSFKIWDCKLLPWRTSSVDHCGVGMSHDWSGLRTPIRNSIAYLRYMAFRLTCCVFFQVWHLSEDSKGFDGADIYWSIHLHFQLPFHSIPLCLRAVIIPHSWDVRNLIRLSHNNWSLSMEAVNVHLVSNLVSAVINYVTMCYCQLLQLWVVSHSLMLPLPLSTCFWFFYC